VLQQLRRRLTGLTGLLGLTGVDHVIWLRNADQLFAPREAGQLGRSAAAEKVFSLLSNRSTDKSADHQMPVFFF
jgi:hypothetical protein